MSMLRRDETPDTLGPRILYLWNKKWWIILPVLFVFFFSYLVMRLLPEEYVATSNLYVSRLNVLDDDAPNPATAAILLQSDQVLRQVRDLYAQKFNIPPPVFERFKKQFDVKSEVLQDTTVKKDVSPVLVLKVQSRGKKETLFLMDTWARTFIEQFGNFSNREARIKLEGLQAEDERLEAALRKAESEHAQVSAELSLQQKLLAEKMDILAPAELQRTQSTPNASLSHNATNMQVVVENSTPKPQGLLRRLTTVQYELARTQEAKSSAQTSSVAELQAEAKALEQTIAQVEKSVGELQKKVSDLFQKQSSLAREILVKTDMQRQLHQFMDRVNAVAALHREGTGANGLPVGGDVQMVSQPVEPELRAWPKRTIVAALLAGVAFVACLTMLLLFQYLREVAERVNPQPAPAPKEKAPSHALR